MERIQKITAPIKKLVTRLFNKTIVLILKINQINGRYAIPSAPPAKAKTAWTIRFLMSFILFPPRVK